MNSFNCCVFLLRHRKTMFLMKKTTKSLLFFVVKLLCECHKKDWIQHVWQKISHFDVLFEMQLSGKFFFKKKLHLRNIQALILYAHRLYNAIWKENPLKCKWKLNFIVIFSLDFVCVCSVFFFLTKIVEWRVNYKVQPFTHFFVLRAQSFVYLKKFVLFFVTAKSA